MKSRGAIARLPVAAVLLVPAGLMVGRLTLNPHLTSDDAFFLDAGFAWLTQRTVALPLWGQGLGHGTFLASYPPLVPMLSAVDAWALMATGSVLGAKITDVVLLALTAWLFWASLAFLERAWVRALVAIAVLIEPVAATYYASLRPEALLIPLVFALFLSCGKLLDGNARFGPAAAASGLALALAHWQFAPTVMYVALVLLVAARLGRVPWRHAVTYCLLTGGAYAAYFLFLVADPNRWAILGMQLNAAAGSAPLLQRVRLFVGTMFEANVESGSAASLLLLLAVIVLLVQTRSARFRAAHEAPWFAWYALGFLVVGVLPAISLAYVGPRIVPLFLVAAWIVTRAASGPAARLLVAVSPAAAALNVGGDLALRAGYFNAVGAAIWWQKSWLWLALAVGVWLVGRRSRMMRAGELALAGMLVVGAATSAALMIPEGVRLTRPNIRATQVALEAVVPPDAPVLCHPALDYIPLRLGHPTRHIFATFPLFYFQGQEMFARLFDGMDPEFILVSDTVRVQMKAVQPAGQLLADQLRAHFVLSTSFEVDGARTWVYKRSPPDL